MRSNSLLQDILTIEPLLKPIVERALKQKNVEGYNRIATYKNLRDSAIPLVGWRSVNPYISDMKHYDAIVLAIADLLPADYVDLYPDGKGEGIE